MAQRNDNERIAVERKRSTGSHWLWIIGAIALIAIALFLLIPLFNTNDSAGPDTGTTISEIVQAPNTYVGQTVTVSGAVNDVIGPRAFTLGGDELYGDAELLVVSAKDIPTPQARTPGEALLSRDVVQVTGPVSLFNLAEFERDVGVDLDDIAFEDWAGKPAVIAQSLDLTPFVAQSEAVGEGLTNITLDKITENPAAFAGQRVVVDGGVNVVLNENAFTIADNTLLDTNEMLVLNATGQALERALAANEPVIVLGTVRTFNLAELEQDLGYDLQDDMFTDYEGKPVIVAGNVSVADQGPAGAGGETAPFGQFMNVSVADITSDPAAYAGQSVAVQAEVEAMITPQAFSLDEDALLAGGIDNDLLVVSANETPVWGTTGLDGQAFGDAGLTDQNVIVAGPVRLFNLAEFERDLGYDFDDAAFADWEGKPAIVARFVRPLEVGQATATPPDAGSVIPNAGAFRPVTGEEAISAGIVPGVPNVTVAEITSNLSEFAGQQVAVRSEVEEIVGPTAFKLDEDALLGGGIDNDLLVLSADQNNALLNDQLVDQTVVVRGTVRQFDLAAFESELGYDLDDTLFTDWAGKPALIATEIRPVNMDANVLVPNTGMTGVLRPLTVAEITSNLTELIGQPVALVGEVEEVISPAAFSIDEDATFAGGIDNDLLVVAAGQNIPFINDALDDSTVLVAGPVRQFDLAAFEQEIGFDLDDAAFEGWTGRPAVVAQAILVAE